LFLPFAAGIILVLLALTLLFNYNSLAELPQVTSGLIGSSTIILIIASFIILILLGIYVSYYIYTNNRFFLTNESIIQQIQTGLFYKCEQTVSLSDIEDTSYAKNGIFQQIFDYGSIRLSTIGDETTYRFSYVANPEKYLAKLNNAVEAFKNGRTVEDSQD